MKLQISSPSTPNAKMISFSSSKKQTLTAPFFTKYILSQKVLGKSTNSSREIFFEIVQKSVSLVEGKMSLSNFIITSMSVRINETMSFSCVVKRLPLTPAGFAKGFAFCKTRRCTKSRRASYVAKPTGDVTEARRDFVTSVRGLA